jgi:hypothetical protein
LLTRPAFPNPRFAGSEALGGIHGADGDLIVGSCLIDFKATVSPFIQVLWLRQLLAHVLLDYEDAYRLEWVALYLVRQAKLLSWKLADLLPILTGQADVSVPALREELRAIIDQYQALRKAS